MKKISTHVLDTSLGKPANDVAVRLARQAPDGQWVLLHSARTDADGRCAQLLPENSELHEGLYRLSFDTASYHHALGMAGLYPVVEITFQARKGETHFHIPLLLSPHGYSTYRGN